MAARLRSLAFALLVLFPAGPPPAGASPQSSPTTPLTMEQVLYHQPDFVADMTTSTHGFDVTQRVAVEGAWVRMDSNIPFLFPGAKSTVMLIMPGRPVRVAAPDRREYYEMPAEGPYAAIQAAVSGRLVLTLPDQGTKVKVVGTEVLDGHPTTKFFFEDRGGARRVRFWAAHDLRGLVIRTEVSERVGGRRSDHTIRLSKISLDVPDELFELPADYTRVAPPRQIPFGAVGGMVSPAESPKRKE